MAEKIKASFRASEEQKTEWVHIDMVAANYNLKMIYGEKNLDVFFSWNFHLFPSHYWYCPFFPTFCVIAPLNQSGDGDMECYWSNQFFPL